MLDTKSQTIDLLASGKTILKVFTLYGCGGRFDHATTNICASFRSSILRSLSMKLSCNGPVVLEKKLLKMLTDDGRLGHWYTYL